jgi:hypothetical protein
MNFQNKLKTHVDWGWGIMPQCTSSSSVRSVEETSLIKLKNFLFVAIATHAAAATTTSSRSSNSNCTSRIIIIIMALQSFCCSLTAFSFP